MGVLDRLPVHRDDHIPGAEARLGRGALRADLGDERAAPILQLQRLGEGGRQVLGGDPEVAAQHFAVGDETVDHLADQVGGDGEADALKPAGATEDRGVNADEAALDVDQGPAGIARVNCGVGLHEVLVFEAEAGAAAQCADDAGGDRLADAEGIADRQHAIAHLDAVAVRDGGGGQVAGLHLEHGDVRLRIAADDAGLEVAPVVHLHRHLVGALDHMVIGHDVAV